MEIVDFGMESNISRSLQSIERSSNRNRPISFTGSHVRLPSLPLQPPWAESSSREACTLSFYSSFIFHLILLYRCMEGILSLLFPPSFSHCFFRTPRTRFSRQRLQNMARTNGACSPPDSYPFSQSPLGLVSRPFSSGKLQSNARPVGMNGSTLPSRRRNGPRSVYFLFTPFSTLIPPQG